MNNDQILVAVIIWVISSVIFYTTGVYMGRLVERHRGPAGVKPTQPWSHGEDSDDADGDV